MARHASQIIPGLRCAWPDRCGVKVDHDPSAGDRRSWSFHDVQCQIPNPRPVHGPDPAGPLRCSTRPGCGRSAI
jgi:hypothetical protein